MANTPSKNKSYSLDQSPIYRLRTRRKLANQFNLSVNELEKLAKRQDNYRVFIIGKDKNKPRQVEEPKPHLERIHRRLFNLLRRIEPPVYLHSGIKGKSYISNAKIHIGSDTLITLDIEKFFPSTLGWHVFEFFHDVMSCTKDVAGLLTKICTCHDHIPTGSCLSQILAFYAHYEMFEEMYALAVSRDLTMTCYVDDIAISGKNANKAVLYQIRGILDKRCLKSNPRKESIFKKGVPKQVTGSIVLADCLKLPNKKHRVIHEEVISILELDDTKEKLDFINRTMGRMIAASQSDPEMSSYVKSLRCEKNRIEKLVGNH
jgi:RNA-directed DNA polymerase